MISEDIKNMLQLECGKEQNEFGAAFFDQHILVVRDNACRLADFLGVDREVVELAAYLHDISAIQDFCNLARHAEISAEIAEKILEDRSFDSEKIETIKRCIITHSKPIQIGDGPLEAVCISNADAISQIIRPAYWTYYIFSVRKMSFEQGREWYSMRIKENWDSLIQPAQDMIREEYDHMKALFL